MSGRRSRVLCAAAIAISLMTAMPGCYIRRGFSVRWNWSLHAHRYGCHGATCEPDDPAAVVENGGECADCNARGGHHAIGGRRAAEGPPPLAPDPEPAGPSYFHPVPTRPVFGPRSEQPDAIEAPALMPLPAPAQGDDSMSPLLAPPSSDPPEADGPDIDEPPSETSPDAGSSTKLRRLPAPSATELTGWKAKAPKVRKRTVRSTPPAKKKPPCPHCSVTFKPRREAPPKNESPQN